MPHLTLLQVDTKTLLKLDDATTDKVQQYLSTIIPKYGLDRIGFQVNYYKTGLISKMSMIMLEIVNQVNAVQAAHDTYISYSSF